MKDQVSPKGTLVTGVIGEDVHIVGVRILEHTLRGAGFKVVPLGAQVSQEEFINAAIETKADAIMVSSLCGHAKVLGQGLRGKCLEAGLKDVLLYIGGLLTMTRTDWKETEKTFRDMGFNRVYPPDVSLEQVLADLDNDIIRR